MNINSWLNAHYLAIGFILAGLAFRWAAGQFLANATKGGGDRGGQNPGGGKKSKWNKSRIIKFVALVFYFAAGLCFAVGAYPFAKWLTGFMAGLGSWLSIAAALAILAAGWHSLNGLIGLVHDMSDGTPDDEAFKAAFAIPTTLPLGWAALVGLFTNPRGVATGVAVVGVSLITAIYAHKILKKTHSAQGHYGAWMYVSTIICVFVGLAHIPAMIYLNAMAGDYLPEWAAWLARGVLVVAGIIFFVIGLGDWLRDRIPEKWTQWAAMYTIPTFTVLTVSVATLSANAGNSLHVLMGAF